ncbi:hypothetical protein KGQ20_41670, partial [Catenulispora sp. NF23]|uniref:hypothetical protein n=1 Tax=Catenulispora pinistramenti TaxID=2705254 RepID=UPI001BA626BF
MLPVLPALEILRSGLEQAMLLSGCRDLAAARWLMVVKQESYVVLYQATFAREFSRCGSRRAGQRAGSVGGWSLLGAG